MGDKSCYEVSATSLSLSQQRGRECENKAREWEKDGGRWEEGGNAEEGELQ